jgi:hypothetical protein
VRGHRICACLISRWCPKSFNIVQCFNPNKVFRILPLLFFLPPIGIQLHSHLQFAADASIAWRLDAIYDIFHQPSAGTKTRRI